MQPDFGRQPDWNWSQMIEAFCALGGVIQNIAPGGGNFYTGLVAVDPAEPVLLRVPRNLLLPVDDIEFAGDLIGIRESAEVPEAERRFFERYQTAFSWGAEGRAKSAAFIAALEGLPVEIQELLIAEFGMGYLLEGDLAVRIQTHYLRRRAITWRGGAVIAPLLELADHRPEGFRYERGLHLQIQGYARNEIALRFSAEDAYSVFCRFGIAEPRPTAFSLPSRVRFDDKQIIIGRNTDKSVKRGEDRVPKTSIDGNVVTLSHMLLGNRQIPRLPRGICDTLLAEAGVSNPGQTFDHILRFNALKFIGLLRTLEAHEGETISLLRRVARYQLEAMNYCIGSRQIGPAALPVE